jgi:C4-dicarboxylate-specific signal transduction histidine kinase
MSSMLSLLATFVQLYSDYRYDVTELESRFQTVQESYLEPLSLNLWNFYDEAVQQQLNGIKNLPNVNYVELTTPQQVTYTAGVKLIEDIERREFDVRYKNEVIGRLLVEVNYVEIYQKLKSKFGLILVTQLIKTFIAAFFILAIVYWLITRHLYRISAYSAKLSTSFPSEPLSLSGKRVRKDELDTLVTALNDAKEGITQEFNKRIDAETELIELNNKLEQRVFERTSELENAIQNLESAKSELVAVEKNAALGQLVAGIAHEINTPLGVGMTANMMSLSNLNIIKEQLSQSTDKNEVLLNAVEDLIESNELVTRNLNKASDLVKSFKSIAMNQEREEVTDVNMHNLFSEVIGATSTYLKMHHVSVVFNVDESIWMKTIPAAWSQILTQLLINSDMHAFSDINEGKVEINLAVKGEQFEFKYSDNGVGIPDEWLDKVFEPFVTTKRNAGSAGIGLSIVSNLVFEKLKGTITCHNLAQGCQFVIKGPVH